MTLSNVISIFLRTYKIYWENFVTLILVFKERVRNFLFLLFIAVVILRKSV